LRTVDLLLINPQISFKKKYEPVELEAAQIRAALCQRLFARYRSDYSLPWLDCAGSEIIDPPTGLLILSSIAKQEGFEVGLVDLNAIQASKKQALSPDEIERELGGFDPRAIGITSWTYNHHIAMRVLRMAKHRFPNSTTVYGGIHATFTDVDVLRTRPFVDCVVRGEAETIVPPLLRMIKKPRTSRSGWRGLEGVTFRNSPEDGPPRIIRNPDNPVKPELNEIPLPDYGLLDREKYRSAPFFHLFGQRGCPYDCAFCANVKFFGRATVRRKRPERVIEEIKLAQSLFGNKVFLINDDTFTSHRKYAMELCQAMEEEALGTCFQVQSRVDRLDHELLVAMRKAQVVYIWLGCESADPAVLRTMNKGISPRQIEDACIKAKEHRMDVGGYWLVGCPGETLGSIRRTRAMIADLIGRGLMDVYEQSIFVPYPGTAVYDDPGKFNAKILTHDFRRYREDSLPVVRLEGLAPEDILAEWLRTTEVTNGILLDKMQTRCGVPGTIGALGPDA
jgi:radical SAM superfamily enzyme YgiQ (UPF0313 family)